MKRNNYSLIDEPKGDLYIDIINYAVNLCHEALLVVRRTIPLADSGLKVLEKLEPYLIEKNLCSEWPGTRLLDDKAHVFRYTLNKECALIIQKSSSRLYEWFQPNLPEDLCFLRTYKDPWLVSIAHEKDAYFSLSSEEKNMLIDTIPALSGFIKKDEF